MDSELISNRDPSIMQVVSSGEYLEEVSVGNELFSHLIDLFWLLRLASPHAEDDITWYILLQSRPQVTLVAYQTSLLGMLEVVAMPFVDLSIDGLFHPYKLVHQSKNCTKQS